MDHPVISVVVATYNRPHFLAELLESLQRQTFQRFQVIIVNDHGVSIDSVCKLYPDLNLKVLDLEHNLRMVGAKNIGIQHVDTEFLMLCDDDDLLLPTHLEQMVNEMKPNELLFSDAEIFDYINMDGTRIPTQVELFAFEFQMKRQKKYLTILSSGCLYPASIHQRVGSFDENMFHYWDWDFFLRVMEKYCIRRVPIASVLYAFSEQGSNMSNDETTKQTYLSRLCEKHHLGQIPLKSFKSLLTDPELASIRAKSMRIWDQKPMVSRLAIRATN